MGGVGDAVYKRTSGMVALWRRQRAGRAGRPKYRGIPQERTEGANFEASDMESVG